MMEKWGCPLSSPPNLHIHLMLHVSLGIVCRPYTQRMLSFWVAGLLRHRRCRFRQDVLTQWVAVLLMKEMLLGDLNVAEPLSLVQRDMLLLTRHSCSQKRRMITGYSGQRTVYHSSVLNHTHPILLLMRITASWNSKHAKKLFLLQRIWKV